MSEKVRRRLLSFELKRDYRDSLMTQLHISYPVVATKVYRQVKDSNHARHLRLTFTTLDQLRERL